MQIKVYTIDFELPRWAKRAAVLVGVPAVVLLGLAALVHADAVSLPTFAANETLSSSKLNDMFKKLQDAVNAANDPDPPCPKGYTRDTSATTIVLCKRGADEVVRVGVGGSAFWIDRYEASVWSAPDGTGTQYGTASADYPATFPRNGQVTSTANLVYAVSKTGVPPSANLTWFQANLACRASGKRLPNGDEWLAAATGTVDPGSDNGATGNCVTNASGPRPTGANGASTSCTSIWGAQDLIGNLLEWTAEWYAGLGNENTAAGTWPDTTGGNYNGDGTRIIASSAVGGDGVWTIGLPATAARGGAWAYGAGAGVFELNLGGAPSNWHDTLGFRCLVPR